MLACRTAHPVMGAPEHTVPGAEPVAFASLDSDLTHGEPTRIDSWLFRPQGSGPFPAVLALHGCAGLYGRDGDLTPRHRDWAERLVKRGYAVLFADSFTPRGLDEICSRSPQPVRPGLERNRDAYAALRFLQLSPFVRGDRVALLGWSNGGMTVLSTVAAQTRARPRDLVADFRVAIAFYPSCRAMVDRDDWLPPAAPVHILIGDRDDWTKPGPCFALAERARAAGAPVDLVVYPGAFHDFDDPSMPVHIRSHVATTPSGQATIGTDPAARADAIGRVMRLLEEALGP